MSEREYLFFGMKKYPIRRIFVPGDLSAVFPFYLQTLEVTIQLKVTEFGSRFHSLTGPKEVINTAARYGRDGAPNVGTMIPSDSTGRIEKTSSPLITSRKAAKLHPGYT